MENFAVLLHIFLPPPRTAHDKLIGTLVPVDYLLVACTKHIYGYFRHEKTNNWRIQIIL